MPTPSSSIAGAASNTSTSLSPAACSDRASDSPPIPPPATRILTPLAPGHAYETDAATARSLQLAKPLVAQSGSVAGDERVNNYMAGDQDFCVEVMGLEPTTSTLRTYSIRPSYLRLSRSSWRLTCENTPRQFASVRVVSHRPADFSRTDVTGARRRKGALGGVDLARETGSMGRTDGGASSLHQGDDVPVRPGITPRISPGTTPGREVLRRPADALRGRRAASVRQEPVSLSEQTVGTATIRAPSTDRLLHG